MFPFFYYICINLFIICRNNVEKSRAKLVKSQTCITELKEQKSKPERKLTLIQNIMSDIMLWDRSVDEISELKQTINSFQTRMLDAGILMTLIICEFVYDYQLISVYI